jgi:hypothetical protein
MHTVYTCTVLYYSVCMQTMDAYAKVLGIRYDGVSTKGMTLIGQNNTLR